MELTVTSITAHGTFQSGEYLCLEGIFYGELSVTEAISGLEKAPRNERGRVAYSTTVRLIVPQDPRWGNGALLVDLPNRGLPSAHYIYNNPLNHTLPFGSLGAGNGFLEDHGFLMASVQWELGRGINLPAFTDGLGRKRYVEGAALVVIRDFLDWLRFSSDLLPGLAAPLSQGITRVLGVGWSQTGRLLKTLLLHGFNLTRHGLLIDGIHHQAGPTGWLPLLQSGSGPDSSAVSVPTPDHPDMRGVVEEPLTPAALLKVMAERGESAPRMIFTVMSLDYYILRASLFRTGAKGCCDLPIPESVRVYDVAGGAHALVPTAGCAYPRGTLDWGPVMRAVLLHLDRWVKEGVPPPPNRLMPLAARPRDPAVLQTPAHLPEAVVQVPKVDSDGNPLGGIRLPDIEVPLGTHGAPNAPASDFGCFISGSFVPFCETEAERSAQNDTRRSRQARYPNPDVYLERVRAAAEQLVQEGFLLEEDRRLVLDTARQEAKKPC
ncbi:alpha/beta hydrolase domain-containing protein [Anthocerotibacter panamensis]|uniref:alpha/beta hydrolase domain-containing protein n=1 Tax=Anthocerotibacter panamensis TaxID=2857077 RepID=UPI001C403E14|nr:alpha/beta hydrolase domain-containing protein [Anthocerotibacter panamensis]